MNLKTYRAPTMAQALAEVKKDLGKDAVILHTRSYRVGAIMGFGGKAVVEITASDQAAAREAQAQARRNAAREPVGAGVATLSRAAAVPDEFVPAAFETVRAKGDEKKRQVEKHGDTGETPVPRGGVGKHEAKEPFSQPLPSGKVGQIVEVKRAPVMVPKTPAPFAPVNDESLRVLHDELASIRRLVGQVLQCSRQTAITVAQPAGDAAPGSAGNPSAAGVLTLGGMPDPLFALYLRLQEVQVAPEIAETIIGSVRDELTPGELGDAGVVRSAVLRRVAMELPTASGVTPAGIQPDGRSLVMALVGPTGVGKTTTIAKLAATYKLRQGRRVALITSDTYRIAAVDQLRTYANIIGLPLKVATTPQEMAGAVASLADYDVVLVDTAGRSQHDATRLTELKRFIEAARPHETHLVLSSTVAEAVLHKTAERFGALNPTRVIFSKLDESVHLGVLVNLCRRLKTPISYVTTGQEVPDQIDLANSDRLARMVLDGGPTP